MRGALKAKASEQSCVLPIEDVLGTLKLHYMRLIMIFDIRL